MAQTSPALSLPYIQAAQAQKHVTHNEAIRLLDLIVQPAVSDASLITPPGAPITGDRYIVAPGGTGAWAGQDGALTIWDGTGWIFAAPQIGWQARDIAAGATLIYDGTGWAVDGASPATLGINASADATNRLSVSAPAVLLTHEGAGHQLKINKAAAADTASLLFQTNWSGRAEMGLTGSDDFAIKVSADGSTFTTALEFDGATGGVSGAAIQQSATDTTAGRLMRADYGYGPGNLVGTVSNAAGTPTGAVIETGSNANGTYTRYADGTQICAHALTLSQEAAERVGATWTFPVPFVVTPTGISGTVNGTDIASAAPSAADLGALLHDDAGATSTKIRQYRVTGATNFGATDTVTCRVIALGRWA